MRLLSCVILIGAAMAGSESPAVAQELSYGVKGGANLATLTFDPELIDFADRIGIVAGGFVTWPIGERLAVQPEALYSQKGAKVEIPGVEATIKIDYLEVPVLVKFSPGNQSGTSFHVFGGPMVAFKLEAEATAESGNQSAFDDISDDIKSFDFGVTVGGGVGFGRFTVDGRYTLGLSNINDDADDPTKVRTRAITVLAGFRF